MREAGYYWVRYKGRIEDYWEPARWAVTDYDESWEIIGLDFIRTIRDEDMIEINENRIERDALQMDKRYRETIDMLEKEKDRMNKILSMTKRQSIIYK